MAIPDYQSLMYPLLRLAGDKEEHKLRDATDELSIQLKLTEEEKEEQIPSGGQSIIHNRVGWASAYFKKAGLLESTRRGYFKITERGVNVIK